MWIDLDHEDDALHRYLLLYTQGAHQMDSKVKNTKSFTQEECGRHLRST